MALFRNVFPFKQVIEASPNACDRQETGTKNLLVTEEDHLRSRVAGKENTHVIETGPHMSHVIGTGSHEESSHQVVDQNNGRRGKAVGFGLLTSIG